MRRLTKLAVISLTLVLILVFTISTSLAQSETTGHKLVRWTVDSGESTNSGSSYTVKSTAGQPDAGTLSSGTYTLNGGFWGTGNAGYATYLPVVIKNK